MYNGFIISNNPSKKQKLRELWIYKEVIFFLSWKDIIVRYKQTILGFLWAIIQPLFSMAIMTFVFGKIAKLPDKGIPYAVLVYSAMLPWNLFSSAFSSISNSLVSNSHIITKIYFPRLTLPISAIVTSFIDFIISSVIFAILLIVYEHNPPIKILLIPIPIIMVVAISLGTGLIFATLNVRYRDIRYLIPVVLQFGMYISPVGYTSEVIPSSFRLLYSINPLVGIIEGFRWCIIPNAVMYWPSIFVSVAYSMASLIIGVKFFSNFENTFADFI